MSTFTHTPRPAITTDRPGSTWQRRFGNASDPLGYELTASTDRERATIDLLRDATTNVTEMRLNIGIFTAASMSVRLTCDELRELAARLIDAAHDIETLPAAVLAQEAA